MANAYVLKDGTVVKESFFDGVFLFNDEGTVRDFFHNGKFYRDFYILGTSEFIGYAEEEVFNNYQRTHQGENPSRSYMELYTLKEADFQNYLAQPDEDTVYLKKRFIKTTAGTPPTYSICYKVSHWLYKGETLEHDEKKNVKPPPTAPAPTDDCSNTMNSALQSFVNKNMNKTFDDAFGTAHPMNKEVVADIAQILDEIYNNDPQFAVLLNDTNMLPVKQAEVTNMNSAMPTQAELADYWDKKWAYDRYGNEQLEQYRDSLLRYRAYFQSLKAKANTFTGREKAIFVAEFFDSGALSVLSYETKAQMILDLAAGNLTGNWLVNKPTEPLMVKLVKSIGRKDLSGNLNVDEIDKFMDLLQSQFNKSNETLFQVLYGKIQNTLMFSDGKGNLSDFIKEVMSLWEVSKYNPYRDLYPKYSSAEVVYTYDNKLSPMFITYNVTTALGLYLSDMLFSFALDDGEFYTKNISIGDTSSPYPGLTVLKARYHMFQPVFLANKVNESLIKIPYIEDHTGSAEGKCLIPIFFLKYKSDVQAYSNIKQLVSISIDTLLTASGVGNIGKLRHLRLFRLAKWGLAEYKVVVGAIEFTSSLLGLFKDYVLVSCSTPFCEEFKKWAGRLELVTAGISAIGEIMLRRASKRLKDAIDLNGIPNDFGTQAQREEFVDKINDLANSSTAEAATLAQRFAKNIQKNVLDRLQQLNIGKNPREFEMIHSVSEIEDIIQHGDDLNLAQKEIEDFILVSCRVKPPEKKILANDLIDQMDNWITIRDRGYPYTFANLQDYENFSAGVIGLAEDFKLPTDRIFIQGSSLRKANPHDVDIAIFINESELAELRVRIINNLASKRNSTGVYDPLKFKKDVDKLFDNIKKGKISQIDLGKFGGNSLMQEFYNRGLKNFSSSNNFNISVIIERRNFNIGPFMKM